MIDESKTCQEYTTSELVDILIQRLELSNGFEFIEPEQCNKLLKLIIE